MVNVWARHARVGVVVAIVIAVSTAPPVSAQTVRAHRSVNPRSFEIKGVRLGMTAPEVLSRLTALVADNPNSQAIPNPIPCESDIVQRMRTGKDVRWACTTTIALNGDKYQLGVTFIEDFPSNPGVSRAYDIMYYGEQMNTLADQRAFFSAALSKYGAPSYQQPDTLMAFYCPATAARPWCSNYDTGQYASPDLWLTGNRAELMDWRYRDQRQKAIDTAVRNTRTHTDSL